MNSDISEAVDFTSVRSDFPAVDQRINDKPLVYLDSAATSHKPIAVLDAISGFYRSDNANVHRAQHTLAARATEAYEGAREKARRFIGAAKTSEIVFTHGATEAINLVAASYGKRLQKGDAVLLTEMEHHSNLIPWQLLAKERSLNLVFIPFDKDGVLDYEEMANLWSNQIKLVSMSHMSNVFGTINDVRRVVDFAHSHGVPVMIDGAQSVPHLPVNVRDLDCDFYAFSGHKMCGPTGIGVLYGREELLEEMDPFLGGGEMISSVWLDRAKWNDLPYKFEAGTPNIAGAVGLGAAIDYLDAIGMDAISRYEHELTEYALGKLTGIPGVTVYGPKEKRGGVLSFNFETVHAHDVAQFLDSRGVAIRAGHHCAHPLMRKLDISSTARASLYLYNNHDDVDIFIESLTECREFFTNGL